MPYTTTKDKVILTSGDDKVVVFFYGATVSSWESCDKERLYLSKSAKLDGSKAIRGGIPLVFPVFGKYPAAHEYGDLPQHGFARISTWRLTGVVEEGEEEVAKGLTATFELGPEDVDPKLTGSWPNAFKLQYRVSVSKCRLETQLTVQNPGRGSWPFHALFHTYLRAGDANRVRIHGLQGLNYTDKVLDGADGHEVDESISLTGETDRVYAHAPDHLTVEVDEGLRIEMRSSGTEDVVVWNPWAEKAKAMGDFDDDGWKEMVCVEIGSVATEVALAGEGGTWEGRQVLEVKEACCS
ncbi:MAG: galactose mutarotase-like domain-containing protein [Piptocephalis tieghemiana]|nr:MAG: galactose mutarotase-like domain-containing protein [Piptocephalis tieghemiana]